MDKRPAVPQGPLSDGPPIGSPDGEMEIFLATLPGFEALLAAEVAEAGFTAPLAVAGGVTIRGGWPEIWRANLELRGATRVLARIAAFRAPHLAQLDKRARRVPWAALVRPGTAVRVEAICRRSRIYHARAAAQRVTGALTSVPGVGLADAEDESALKILVRIEDDLCTISLDTTGEPLHRRGHKQAVGKAPLRETMAALFLRACGFDGTEPVLDPMCGSGTIPIEAAEIAARLAPGRSRSFAFERLAAFDPGAWGALRARQAPAAPERAPLMRGFDRDQGVVASAAANAARAGVVEAVAFACQPISALTRPEGPAGLVLVNPPYGGRIGARKLLFALYGSLGAVLSQRFAGWRVGVITSDPGLAAATGLPFVEAGPPIPHGGLRIRLHRTGPLA